MKSKTFQSIVKKNNNIIIYINLLIVYSFYESIIYHKYDVLNNNNVFDKSDKYNNHIVLCNIQDFQRRN